MRYPRAEIWIGFEDSHYSRCRRRPPRI